MATPSAANRGVVPWRLASCLMVPQRPCLSGKLGWVRSIAWIWLLFVHSEHQRLVGWIEIQAGDVLDLVVSIVCPITERPGETPVSYAC